MKDLETRVQESLERDAESVRFDPARWKEVTERERRHRRMPSLRRLGVVAAALMLLAGILVPLVLISGLSRDASVRRSIGGEPSGQSPGDAGFVRHVDTDDGLAITLPEAWSFDPDPTRPIEPENVLAIGSWPFPSGGVCAPFDAIGDLPLDGVFMWLIEYHGPESAEDFVPRPERFDLRAFQHGETSCYAPTPQYQLRFQDAGRNFQVQIAFGPHASESLEPEILRALESLETGGICDSAGDAYVPSVEPTGGPAGSTATITGEVPHGEGAEGGSPADPTEWVEVWWNLDPSDPDGWPSALPGGEEPIPAEPGPVLLLSRLHVSGTCTYELPFTVPDTQPRSYPIVVIQGSDLGASAFVPVRFEVTGPSSVDCPEDTGPWADPDCPWSKWTREVVEVAGDRVVGDTGSALRAETERTEYFIWTTETGRPPADEGYEPWTDVDAGTTVYTDGIRIAWQGRGLTVWVERNGEGLVPVNEIEELARASLQVDYTAVASG